MATTSLKLPDDLKTRAASAAKIRGVSTHAFMLDAIQVAARATEQRASFIAEAKAADEEMLRTGKGYAAQDVHKYLMNLVSGRKARKPRLKSWRK